MRVTQKSWDNTSKVSPVPHSTSGDVSSSSDARTRWQVSPGVRSGPWLADCLIAALQVYLPPYPEPQPTDSPFEFSNDNSNLFILVKSGSNINLRLLEWQLSLSGKVVTAVVTDDEIQVKATFRTSDLDCKTSSAANLAQLATGTILETSEFELRLADCFEPPRFTIHLKKFNVLDEISRVVATHLPTIHSHKLASQYLHKWQQQEEIWRMELGPSSPLRVRSQIDSDSEKSYKSDIQVSDLASISQAQFATQLPVRESPKQSKSRSLYVSRLGERELDAPGHGQRQEIGGQLSQSLKHVPQPMTSLLKGNEIESTGVELSQRQLVAPSSNWPVQQNEEHIHEQFVNDVSSVLDKGKQFSTPPEYMPKMLVQLLRGLREECQNGRHVPRRLQIIPKDQAKLLESDDRWQPPLVGRVQRLGTVPLDLLNRITREADSPKSQLEPNPEPSKTDSHNDHPATHPGLEEENPKEGSSSSSEDGTDSSEPVEWSSSPPRPQRPLDSSPLEPCCQKGVDFQQEQKVLGQQNENLELSRRSPEAPVLHRSSQKQDDTLVRSENAVGSPMDTGHLSSIQSEVREIILPKLVASTSSEPKSKFVPVPFQKDVQVKRTPVPAKEMQPQGSIPESSGNVISGTFDERRLTSKNNMLSKARNTALGASVTPNNREDVAFDVELLERDTTLKRKKDNTHAGSPEQYRGVVTPTLSAVHAQDNSNSLKKVRSGKRELEHGEVNPSKRAKTTKVKSSYKDTDCSDYQAIDEERTRYRRKYLSKISRRNEPVISSVSSHEVGNESEDSQNFVRLNTSVSSPPPARLQERAETSDIHYSVHYKHPVHIEGIAESISAPSISNFRPAVALYARFKAAYPNYGGERQHFDATCQLLKKLQLQSKATHPSLWDDFVFRHYHDYRDHLWEVMQTSGNALPYETFYEECIEQPTYLQRVVKPSYIKSLSLDSTSNLRPSLAPSVDNVSTKDSHAVKTTSFTQLNRSVATEGCTSDVIPNKQKPHPKSQTEQPESRMPGSIVQKGLHVQETAENRLQNSSNSQESRTSVKSWLEKAAGAESPILGTPQTDSVDGMNTPIPVLSLDIADELVPSSAATKQRRRTLPWNHPTPHDDNESIHKSVDTISARSTSGLAAKSPSSSRPKKAVNIEVQGLQIVTLPSAPVTSKHELQSSHQHPETAFQRFARFYNDMPAEKGALKGHESGTRKLIDIFSWRD